MDNAWSKNRAKDLMRALVIAPQPFFSPRGTPFSVYYRTLIMAELGIKVDLLTYGEGQDVDIENTRILRTPRFKWLGNVKTGPSMLKLFLDFFIVLRSIGLLIRNRYEIVHAHEEAVFFCRFLKPVFRFKLIYDMHSSLPQQLSNFDYTESKIIHGLFKKLEDSSINAADAVITICPDLADYVESVIVDSSKHFLIENSIFEPVNLSDKTYADTAPPSAVAEDVPKNKKYLVYAGTLEHYQGIDLLISAFRRASEQLPDIFLIIVGGTDEQVEKYRSFAAAEGVKEKSLFTGRLPQSQAAYYSEMADVLVSPRTEGTNTPLKVYQQLASGKPLVATNIYSHTQVLSDDVAFLTSPEAAAFGDAIISAMSDRDLAEQNVRNALRLYEEKYSRTSYVSKLQQLMGTLN